MMETLTHCAWQGIEPTPPQQPVLLQSLLTHCTMLGIWDSVPITMLWETCSSCSLQSIPHPLIFTPSYSVMISNPMSKAFIFWLCTNICYYYSRFFFLCSSFMCLNASHELLLRYSSCSSKRITQREELGISAHWTKYLRPSIYTFYVNELCHYPFNFPNQRPIIFLLWFPVLITIFNWK